MSDKKDYTDNNNKDLSDFQILISKFEEKYGDAEWNKSGMINQFVDFLKWIVDLKLLGINNDEINAMLWNHPKKNTKKVLLDIKKYKLYTVTNDK